jgi:hypothetical protein
MHERRESGNAFKYCKKVNWNAVDKDKRKMGINVIMSILDKTS